MDVLARMTTFVRVIEAGSLTAAARQLRLTPAAVSRQLAALEAELGAPLIARTTRRMSVTATGQRYYERCLRILRDVDEAQALGKDGGARGTVAVSAPVTFGLASAVPRLRALMIARPELRLDLRIEDRLIDLALEGVDVALRVAGALPMTTDVVAQRLVTWRRVLVAAPAYLRRRGEPRAPAALAGHDALSHALDARAETWTLVKDGETARVRMAVRCATNAGQALRELAVDGAGVAMMPPWFVVDEVRARRLKVVLPGWGSEPIVAHALYRAAHRGEERVRAVVEHLRRSYADDPPPAL